MQKVITFGLTETSDSETEILKTVAFPSLPESHVDFLKRRKNAGVNIV